MKQKHKLHSVFKKPDGKFAVQCPKGILTFRLKRDAVKFSDKIKKIYEEKP